MQSEERYARAISAAAAEMRVIRQHVIESFGVDKDPRVVQAFQYLETAAMTGLTKYGLIRSADEYVAAMAADDHDHMDCSDCPIRHECPDQRNQADEGPENPDEPGFGGELPKPPGSPS